MGRAYDIVNNRVNNFLIECISTPEELRQAQGERFGWAGASMAFGLPQKEKIKKILDNKVSKHYSPPVHNRVPHHKPNREPPPAMNKEQAHKKYAAAMNIRYNDDLSTTEKAMLAIFPDWESLTRFALDVGSHTYPGSYGASPYDRAFGIAHHALGKCVTNPHVIDSDDYFIAMRYRERAGLSTSRNNRGEIG